MSDDKTKKALDAKLISLTEDYEVRYWSERFAITADELREIVGKVGHSVKAVEEYLVDQAGR